MAKKILQRNLEIKKKLLSVLLGIAVTFAAIPAGPAYAEEDAAVPAITIGDNTISAGSSGTIYISGSNFQRVTALKISVQYNSEVMTISSAGKSSLLNGSVSDVNYSENGIVKLSAISTDGISGSSNLMYVSFHVSSNAKPKDYPVELIVEEACALDDNGEVRDISITKQSGRVTVKEAEQTIPTAYFYGSLSNYSPKEGESFDYYLRSSNVGNLAGGNFEFTYDREHLELTDVKLGSALTAAYCTTSINRKTAGYVKVSFGATNPIRANYGENMVKLTFKVIAKEATSTPIEFSPGELQEIKADDTLGSMNSRGFTHTVKIVREEAVVENPKFRMEYEEVTHGESYKVTAIIEGESQLAAGDFTIAYDRNMSICTEVAICTGTGDESTRPGAEESMIVTRPQIDQGTVKFSFVNTLGISEDQRLIVMTFKRLKAGGTIAMSASGSQTVKADSGMVSIDYPALEIDFSHYLKIVEMKAKPDSDDVFIEKYRCTGCGYEETREISGLSCESVNVHFDTGGILGKTVVALYAKDADIYEVRNDMMDGATSALVQVECESGTTGTISMGGVPTGEYIAVVYNSRQGLYYNKIEIGMSGKTVGLAADIAYIAQTGECNLHIFTYGDVDGNGKVDFADVLWAKRYLAEWNGYMNANRFAIDVNCDGETNINDINIMARYIAKWEDYKEIPQYSTR